MNTCLNWSFDHNYHQEANCDYEKKLFEYLEHNEQYSVESPLLHYAILPNFRFDHKCPKIQNQDEMTVGELEIWREKKEDFIFYQVKYEDSTSGSKVLLEFKVHHDRRRTMVPAMKITRSAVHEETVRFRVENGKPILDIGDFSYCTDEYQSDNQQDLIQIYSLIDSIGDSLVDSSPFTLVDKSGQMFENCRLTSIGRDKIRLRGREEELTGYCLVGTGYPPSYWWVDTAGRVIIVSTILLTYVLG